jgi:hypothetical protein
MQSYRLANRFLCIEVIPELGAKIVSMRNLATGREWMWRPRPDAKLFRNQPADAFDASTLIGADECVPTIAPCRFHGRELPDHGEVWSAPWAVDSATLSAHQIETTIRFPRSPLELRRTVSLKENEILFDYLLTSLSSKPESFLWAFHPLMPLETGDCIELPPHIKSVKLGAVKGIAGPTGDHWDWPAPVPGIRLDRIDFGSNAPAYAKLFAEFPPGAEGFAAIRRGRERLLFRFDAAQIPAVGLWFSRGAWNGHTHMAIEPANAPTDSLCKVAATSHSVAEPFGQVSWQFRIVMETSGDRASECKNN